MSNRYHSYSDYDQNWQYVKKYGKLAALWLILRELPLKNFYARCAVGGVIFWYLAVHNWKNVGFMFSPLFNPLYYNSKYDEQILQNYPLINNYVNYKITPKYNSPGLPEFEVWNKSQYKTFYQHHFKSYRYILRTRRVVPWDGTFNQPVFPYIENNDRSQLVHSGISEIIQPTPSGNW